MSRRMVRNCAKACSSIGSKAARRSTRGTDIRSGFIERGPDCVWTGVQIETASIWESARISW